MKSGQLSLEACKMYTLHGKIHEIYSDTASSEINMYISNIRGLTKLVLKKPQLASITALNLSHRLAHKLKINGYGDWSHSPEHLTILLTDRCNLRCKICHYANTETPGYSLNQARDMSLSVFQKIIAEVSGKPLVSLTGGEPLLHPDVAEFIAIAKEKDRLCTLTTNGWLLADRA